MYTFGSAAFLRNDFFRDFARTLRHLYRMLASAQHPDDIMRIQLQIQTFLQQLENPNFWSAPKGKAGKRH